MATSVSGDASIRVEHTYTLTESGLVDLNGLNARLLEVDNLIAEGKSKLLALELT